MKQHVPEEESAGGSGTRRGQNLGGVLDVLRSLLEELMHSLAVALDPNLRSLHGAARRQGLRIRYGRDAIDVMNGDRVIRIQPAHWFYAHDIFASFDYYFSAVTPVLRPHARVVDYSFPRFHEVVGYDKHPVFFPSVAEPIETATQYTDFAALKPGMTVIDLGAYAGLTSIVFQEAVGPTGRVVAVEADEKNLSAVRRNFDLYKKATGVDITLVEGAAWKDNYGVEFSSEGNMGASVVEIVGSGRGVARTVPSFTLSSIAERTGLERVDFVKCDIEGGEDVVFSDATFFQQYTPRIVVEPHVVGGTLTKAFIRDLEGYGYSCQHVPQRGYLLLPLVECTPPIRR